MLQNAGLFLWSSDDIERGAMSDLAQADQTVLREIMSWTREYLVAPHPELGRDGPVCPFTKPSLAKQLFFLATPEHGRDVSVLTARLQHWREWYENLLLEKEEVDRNLLTVLVPLPDFDRVDAAPLDQFQDLLKDDFVQHGLMIGQFHPNCDKPGLWNEAFRPLRCPIPLLAMRVMVLYDLPFLMETQSYLDAYLKHFAREIPPKVRGQLVSRLYAPRPAVGPQ